MVGPGELTSVLDDAMGVARYSSCDLRGPPYPPVFPRNDDRFCHPNVGGEVSRFPSRARGIEAPGKVA